MGSGRRLRRRVDARFAEVVAVAGLAVLVVGASVVAQERQDEGAQRLEAQPTPSPAPIDDTVVDLAPPPLPSPAGAPTTAPSPRPAAATTTAAPAVPSPGPSQEPASEQADADSDAAPSSAATRVVVLGVEAPASVRAGSTVTFRVLVRSRGGTPVLTGARFGDGVDGGTPAPCAGLAGPSFDGALEVSHTYAAAGTYRSYFVAALPCGPSSGAGTTVVVTGTPADPAPTRSREPAPTPSATPTRATPTPRPTTTATP